MIDLRPIGMRIVPDEPYGVLEHTDTPAALIFDTEMIEADTQQVLSVSFSGGSVEGDLRWEGNTLYFTPVAGWTAGRRYTLSLVGQVYAVDGRELNLTEHIPFFALSRSVLPWVSSFSPADGASVGVTAEEGAGLAITFSVPMDRKSTEEGFSLDGVGDQVFVWEEDDRVLRICAAKPLSPWTSYRWRLDRALSREGAPLAKPVSAQFTTDRDQTLPRVLEVFPLIRAAPPETEALSPAVDRVLPWVRTGADIRDGLGTGQGIGVLFNKPMDEESLRKAVRLEPALLGRTEVLTGSSMVFIPDRDPEGETPYTLIVSRDTKDTSGLPLGEDYVCFFTPDIPRLRIRSLSVNAAPPLENLEGETFRYYPFSLADSSSVTAITLEFSLPFFQDALVAAALGISLEPWFPASLGPTALTAITCSDDTLLLKWEGLEPGKPGESHFYRLTVPGGKNGITNGQGSFLQNSQEIYMEVLGL
jgi:hypothetical protein